MLLFFLVKTGEETTYKNSYNKYLSMTNTSVRKCLQNFTGGQALELVEGLSFGLNFIQCFPRQHMEVGHFR